MFIYRVCQNLLLSLFMLNCSSIVFDKSAIFEGSTEETNNAVLNLFGHADTQSLNAFFNSNHGICSNERLLDVFLRSTADELKTVFDIIINSVFAQHSDEFCNKAEKLINVMAETIINKLCNESSKNEFIESALSAAKEKGLSDLITFLEKQ